MFTFTFTNSTFIVVKWILVFQTSMFSMEKNYQSKTSCAPVQFERKWRQLAASLEKEG